MNKLTGTILTLPKMSGNVGAKTIYIGGKGDDGATFIPYVSDDCVLSWTNDKDLPNPEPVNIKGTKGDKGDKGDPGTNGKDGYTPVKGVDYFDGQPGKDGADGKDGEDYVLTKEDKQEIAEMAAELVDVPDSGGNVAYDEEQELTEEQKAQARANIGAQPVGEYLTEVPEGYAKNEDIKKVDRKVDTLREVVSKFHSNIVETASGEIITISDASDMELAGLRIFGKTTQNGTPTPDAPVALESVGDGGSIGVTVVCKNLLTAQQMYSRDGGYLETTLDGRNCVRILSNSTVKLTPDFLKPNTQYTVSMMCKCVLKDEYTSSGGNRLMTFHYDDGTISGLTAYMNKNWETKSLASEMGKTVVAIGVSSYDYRSYAYIDIDTFQFEEGATATEYEPYQGQNLSISTPNGLPGIPVSSGGNYTDENGQQWVCDYVDFVSGKYVQRVGSWLFNGNEPWTIIKAGNYVQYLLDIHAKNTIGVMCSHFPRITLAERVEKSGVVEYNNDGNIRFSLLKSEGIVTVDEWKAFLAESPITAYAPIHPIETDLTADELAQYAALHTNYPNTTIFNDGGAGMEVKYVADTKLYIDKKFAELSAALLNQ